MLMKRFITIILLFLSLEAMAQLEVKPGSFKEVPGFVNLNPDENYQIDDNDLPYAVIKVRTENINEEQRKRLNFSGNMGTFIMLEYKDGEVWVYLTAKYADYLKISHPDFSSYEYTLPYDLQPKHGYEMTLVNKTNSPQSLSINSNWVAIKVMPKDAIINIDGNYCQNGKAMLSVDEPHELTITHPLYHSYQQEIYSDANEKKTYEIKLNPAYGWLEIDSKPESGATILINGVKKGVTPFFSDTLVSGNYEVTVLKDMYKNASKKLIVSDNNVTKEDINMTPNFAEVSLTTDRNADIFIDDTKVGTGTWVGRMAEGEHIIEAKKESHRKTAISVNVTSGNNESFIIPDPTPIYGALNINSEPDEAVVYLDRKKIGETPFVINNVLVGEHNISFNKKGYNQLTKAITVIEGQISTINEVLQTEEKKQTDSKDITNVNINDDGRIDKLVTEAYERMQWDINASHILIKCDKNANPQDTLRAYKKALEIRKKILKGADFNEMAVKFSEDPSARDTIVNEKFRKGNRGNLGYFTVFDMVYPFETGAYNTEIGKVTNPIRTDFGYHLIKVNSKTPACGLIKAAHIFFAVDDKDPTKNDAIIKAAALNIYHEINKDGSNWDVIVNKYSDDEGTKNNGGILKPFRVSQIVPEFITAVKQLNINEISEPVKTNYGYHIIKLISKSGVGSFAEEKEGLRMKVENDIRLKKY